MPRERRGWKWRWKLARRRRRKLPAMTPPLMVSRLLRCFQTLSCRNCGKLQKKIPQDLLLPLLQRNAWPRHLLRHPCLQRRVSIPPPQPPPPHLWIFRTPIPRPSHGKTRKSPARKLIRQRRMMTAKGSTGLGSNLLRRWRRRGVLSGGSR